MKQKKLYLPATLAWAAALFVGSVLPITGKVGSGLEALNFKGFGLHLVGYAVFGMLLLLTLKDRKAKYSYAYAVLIAAAYGAAIELVQIYVLTRTPSVVDAAANAIGAFITTTIYTFRNNKNLHLASF